MKKTFLALGLPGLMFGAAMTLPTAPVLAQADEEIIITGHWHHHVRPEDADSASQRISYADLDLSTDWGRHELKHRIRLTARYLCDRLGEPDSSVGGGDSCRDAAYHDALDRVGTIEAHFAPRGTAWVRPKPWQAPYDDAWASRYPDEPGY